METDSGVYKYIYTKVDGLPSYLKMTKCNFCPHMESQPDKNSVRCTKFYNHISKNNDRSFLAKVYYYSQTGKKLDKLEVINIVKIPFWCKLPDSLKEAKEDPINYILKKNKVHLSIPTFSPEYRPAIVEDKSVKLDRTDGETLISKGVFNTDFESLNDNTLGSIKKENKKNIIVKDNICSCCGNDVSDVKRDINDGVCESCWGFINNDKDKKHFSKINNFRLKRGAKWVENNFKKVSM